MHKEQLIIYPGQSILVLCCVRSWCYMASKEIGVNHVLVGNIKHHYVFSNHSKQSMKAFRMLCQHVEKIHHTKAVPFELLVIPDVKERSRKCSQHEDNFLWFKQKNVWFCTLQEANISKATQIHIWRDHLSHSAKHDYRKGS